MSLNKSWLDLTWVSLLGFKSVVVVLYHLFRLFTALYFLVYFSSIVERPEGITRELDDSAKRKTHWVGGRDQEKCRGCRNPLKSEFSVFPETEKCHHLDNGWSWLHPDAFCGLQQLSSVTRAVQFCQPGLRQVWYINYTQQQKKCTCANVETNGRDERA